MDVPSPEDLASCLSQLQSLALTRHGSCLTLPTIASPTALSRGLDTLHDSLPFEGLGLQSTTRYLLNEVQPTLPPGQNATRYFGFVTGGVTPAATVADWFLTLLDPMPQVHLPGESYSTLIEAYTVGMLCDLLGMNRREWTGTFTTGATASNVLGLACARERVLERVMRERGVKEGKGWSVAEQGMGYDSEEDEQQARVPPVHVYVAQPHASVYKAASLVGIGRSRVVDVGQKGGSDAIHGLDFDLSTLETHLSHCQSRKHGAIVVAGLGEVNTGALTAQLPALRRLCDQYGAWLHVDAAFSAFVCLLDGFEWISRHLDEYADSVTSDAHKQLNVPYDCGLFFIRRRKDERAQDGVTRGEGEKVNPEASALEDVLGPGKGKGPAYLAPPPPSTTSTDQTSRAPPSDPTTTTASSTARAHRQALLHSLPSPLFRNIENSRRLRALPVYATLLCYGKRGIADLVRRNVDFARAVEEWMRHGEGREWYEVLTPECGKMDMSKVREPQPWKGAWGTTVLLFRPKGAEAAEVIARIKKTREVYVSPTSWGGKGAIRLAVCNWRTGIEGLEGEGSRAETVQQSRDFEVTTRVLADVMRGQTA